MFNRNHFLIFGFTTGTMRVRPRVTWLQAFFPFGISATFIANDDIKWMMDGTATDADKEQTKREIDSFTIERASELQNDCLKYLSCIALHPHQHRQDVRSSSTFIQAYDELPTYQFQDREAVFPTRQSLGLMKSKLKGAETGHSLLKRKSEALTK